VYGLQRGFAVAGARYLLMSLWKVDDEATAFLMESFYKHWLEGEAPVSALRRAQSKLRSVRPQPFYWGAFVVLGH
jgi:CHAT domain-containing protein